MRIEFRRPARDIQRFDIGCLEKGRDLEHSFPIHHLGARRPGVDMAMHAALIAFVAEIDLQGFKAPAADLGKIRGFNQR
ncbi:hypothetical protein D3C83_110970 [compost metagenome]